MLGPFGDEAVAALISAVVTSLVAILVHYLGRKKPRYLICEETDRTSLEVMEEAQEDTEIHYGGQKVDRLSLMKLRLHNRGSEVLEDADFTVRFNSEVKIVGTPTPTVVPKQDSKLILPVEANEQPQSENEKRFRIRYLNPFRDYQQEVIVDFICDGQITDVTVLGSGPGWSVKSWSLNDKEQIRSNVKKVKRGVGILAVTIFLIAILAESIHLGFIALGTAFVYVLLDTVGEFFIKQFFRWRYGISVGF